MKVLMDAIDAIDSDYARVAAVYFGINVDAAKMNLTDRNNAMGEINRSSYEWARDSHRMDLMRMIGREILKKNRECHPPGTLTFDYAYNLIVKNLDPSIRGAIEKELKEKYGYRPPPNP